MASPERSPSPEFSPLAMAEDIVPLPEMKSAGTTEVDFSGLLTEPLKLHEDLKNGCGGQLWPAGMVLAKHMLRYHRNNLEKARMCVLPRHPNLLRLPTSLHLEDGYSPGRGNS